MQSQADKFQENTSQSSEEKSSKNGTTAKNTNNKLQGAANSSPQTKQATQLQADADHYVAKKNKTGLPDDLKSGIENLSGYSMDDVKVHYNSSKPAQLQAHAYAQGSNIHLASGQEKHLPHEAWHVVQQKQGRVKPTMQMKGKVSINDDVKLEKEADFMGEKAMKSNINSTQKKANVNTHNSPIQRKLYYASNSDRAFSSEQEIDNFITNSLNPDFSKAELFIAYASNDLFYVNYHGSISGRHGYTIISVRPYTARPAVAGRGSAGIIASENAANFEVTGRPAWTEETLKKLKPIQFRDNIRHIIPYHMIKKGFMNWLNNVFESTGGNLNQSMEKIMTLALEIGVTIDIPTVINSSVIQALSIKILGKLNNVPGNLFAGDKTENQRLNSLRQRIEGIKDTISHHDTDLGNLAFDMLQESINGGGGQIYKDILLGALNHFPKTPEERSIMTKSDVESILDLLHISGEIDAMPSIEEIGRLDNPDAFMSNLPLHFNIVQLFQSNNNREAMILLSNLQDPYTNV